MTQHQPNPNTVSVYSLLLCVYDMKRPEVYTGYLYLTTHVCCDMHKHACECSSLRSSTYRHSEQLALFKLLLKTTSTIEQLPISMLAVSSESSPSMYTLFQPVEAVHFLLHDFVWNGEKLYLFQVSGFCIWIYHIWCQFQLTST